MAQPHNLSSTQRMADAVLAGLPEPTSLEGFLKDRSTRGYGYEAIAKDLHSLTNGAVSLSYMTVKRWLADFGLLEEVAS